MGPPGGNLMCRDCRSNLVDEPLRPAEVVVPAAVGMTRRATRLLEQLASTCPSAGRGRGLRVGAMPQREPSNEPVLQPCEFVQEYRIERGAIDEHQRDVRLRLGGERRLRRWRRTGVIPDPAAMATTCRAADTSQSIVKLARWGHDVHLVADTQGS